MIVSLARRLSRRRSWWAVPGAVAACLLLASCATTYRPLGPNGGYGGFQESNTRYYVSFLANSETSKETAYRFFLTRAAQLALERGYRYFYIYHLQDSTRTQVYVTPGESRTYVYRNVMPIYRGDDGYLDVHTFKRRITVYQPPQYTRIHEPGYRGQIVLVRHRIKGQPAPFDAHILYREGIGLSKEIQRRNLGLAVAAGVGTVAIVGVATLAVLLSSGGVILIGAW